MNKKLMGLLILVLFFLALTVNGAENETKWNVTVSKSEMTGEEIWYAFSPPVSPTQQLGFPYWGLKARLGRGYYEKEDEVFYIIEFNQRPIFDNTELKDDYEIINTRIKWDDEIEDVQLFHEHDLRFIIFIADKNFATKIINSDMMLLELDLYGEGYVYFQFPLEGAAEAIDEIHKKFSE